MVGVDSRWLGFVLYNAAVAAATGLAHMAGGGGDQILVLGGGKSRIHWIGDCCGAQCARW